MNLPWTYLMKGLLISFVYTYTIESIYAAEEYKCLIIYPSSRLLKNGESLEEEFRSYVRKTELMVLSGLAAHGQFQEIRKSQRTQEKRGWIWEKRMDMGDENEK